MGVATLRDAFNAVAAPRYAATTVMTSYTHPDDHDWTTIEIRGVDNSGKLIAREQVPSGPGAFTIISEPLPPGADLIVAVQEMARNLLNPPATTRRVRLPLA